MKEVEQTQLSYDGSSIGIILAGSHATREYLLVGNKSQGKQFHSRCTNEAAKFDSDASATLNQP